MKERYETPEMEIVEFETEDIIIRVVRHRLSRVRCRWRHYRKLIKYAGVV